MHGSEGGESGSTGLPYPYPRYFDALVAASKDYVALIELIVGPANGEATNKPHFNGYGETNYLFYLNKGFRLAPSASQDNHKRTWGVSTHARMGVWADSLSEQGFKDAILARRCYASEDEDMVIQFTVNGEMMGSVTPIGVTPVANCRISFEDKGEPNAEYRVKLFYDDAIGGEPAAVIEDVSVEPGVTEVAFIHSSAAGGYYFAKVTQKRSEDTDCNDDAWTAPVWIVDETSDVIVDNTDDPELDEIEWEDASDYVGQTVTVRGRIIRSFNHDDRILFFNYDPDYENTLSLIVFKQDFDNFGGVAALQARLVDKQVRVRGEVSLYRNERMQVKLSSPDQILSVENGE